MTTHEKAMGAAAPAAQAAPVFVTAESAYLTAILIIHVLTPRLEPPDLRDAS